MSASERLAKLLDEDLDHTLRRNPLIATVRGMPGYNHVLPDYSQRTRQARRAREREMLAELEALDAAELQGQDRVSCAILLDRLMSAVEGHEFPEADALVLTTLGGIQAMMPRAAQVTPFADAEDYRDYIRRLDATPRWADETIGCLREGIASGWMTTQAVLDRIVAAIDAHVVPGADKSLLLAPFRNFADTVAPVDRAKLASDAHRAVDTRYQPALRRLRAFIERDYRPNAPAMAGLASFPRGREYYEFLIRSKIVRGVTADQVHHLGLEEVDRLRNEIGEIGRRTEFDGSADEFIHSLRTDSRFFYESADEVLEAYRAMPARVDPLLPEFFHAVPRMPYAVRAMTEAEAASSTAANYMPGSLQRGTSGYFTINALGHADEARWRLETLFLHEAVPGHHLQIARAAEIEGLHPWRAIGGHTSYAEGWAMYAETLGFEMGFFTDPYQHYGHLQAQLFRAARLVTDTGIHAFNWSREQAIAYMSQQGGVDDAFAVSEVDRYFSNPSQALAYLLGLHKFRELRSRSERALGARFRLKDFHATAIDSGAMPLAVLESQVDAWIAAEGAR